MNLHLPMDLQLLPTEPMYRIHRHYGPVLLLAGKKGYFIHSFLQASAKRISDKLPDRKNMISGTCLRLPVWPHVYPTAKCWTPENSEKLNREKIFCTGWDFYNAG